LPPHVMLPIWKCSSCACPPARPNR
jgi:hypothetical protein